VRNGFWASLLGSVLCGSFAVAEGLGITDGVCVRPAATNVKVVCDRWPDCTDLRQFGLDAVRIEGATTNEDKALAVWRWMRRCTMRTDGHAPRERRRWVNSSKILNVYGAHHCAGLSLLMSDIWRSLGYRARRLYRHGHTMADCWYADADGITRSHLFDTNYGWFVYSRGGGHIATAEEIGADFSLYDLPSRTHIPWIDKKMWMWGWCHMVQTALPEPRTMQVHEGETVERLWGNAAKPYQDNVGVRPWDDPDQPAYKREFGNGTFAFVARFGENWRDQLAADPVNAAVKAGRLLQADPGQPAEIMYRVLLPYIVADGEVAVASSGGRVDVETDRAGDWRAVRPAVPYSRQGLTVEAGGPVGRYSYLVRVRLSGGAAVTAVTIKTIVQLNSRSLPTLLAGSNKITVNGTLAKGYAVEVTYVWDDLDGKGRTHTARAASLPFTYTIAAAGRTWQDVTCRRIVMRAVADDGKGSRVLTALPKPSVVPAGSLPSADVRTVIGPKPCPPVKATAQYIKDLSSSDAAVRATAAAALTARPDPAAFDALVTVAYDDVTVAKMCAVQALFRTDRRRAAPILRKLLNKDPVVTWPPKGSTDDQPLHSNLVGTIAAMSGRARFDAFVPELSRLAYSTSTNARWACVRALGRINDPRGYATIRRFCRSGRDDTATISNEAAGRTGDREAIPLLARWLRSKRYPIRTLNAIEALGRIGAEGYTDQMLLHLNRNLHSEAWRATVAEALGRVGEPEKSIPILERLLAKEKWPWVRVKMEAALERLKARSKNGRRR